MHGNDKVISLKAKRLEKKFNWVTKIFNNILAWFKIKPVIKSKKSSYNKKIIG